MKFTQGVLPYPRFWASTRPFSTPLGPYAIKWAVTVLMILAPPAGDAFNFITDLQVYPNAFFNVVMAAGIYAVRYRRAPPHPHRQPLDEAIPKMKCQHRPTQLCTYRERPPTKPLSLSFLLLMFCVLVEQA
ncbi:hypothetical protein B0T25DRAFT_60768 [Lasiosphaeria hispida]|uniref:Uncharacterized protein n=1 Tax=Lasiosphaeria hispida TaxID=260671 RepID=A0AAJ0HWU1_9PEZI|nr:hypothetical protein B0T25DRAFT_60768 [Lasiosphaeria hispida]